MLSRRSLLRIESKSMLSYFVVYFSARTQTNMARKTTATCIRKPDRKARVFYKVALYVIKRRNAVIPSTNPSPPIFLPIVLRVFSRLKLLACWLITKTPATLKNRYRAARHDTAMGIKSIEGLRRSRDFRELPVLQRRRSDAASWL